MQLPPSINHEIIPSIKDPVQTVHNKEKLELIKHHERIFIREQISAESILKTQRENFGITMPILGQFTRKYMHHRPISNLDRIKIHGGKVKKKIDSNISILLIIFIGNYLFFITFIHITLK